MAIYGIGAMYGGTEDMTEIFLEKGGAYLGWDREDAPYAHQLLHRISIGDIVFIKSYPPTSGLHIKAVGVVTEAAGGHPDSELGMRVGVDWRWTPPSPEKIAAE